MDLFDVTRDQPLPGPGRLAVPPAPPRAAGSAGVQEYTCMEARGSEAALILTIDAERRSAQGVLLHVNRPRIASFHLYESPDRRLWLRRWTGRESVTIVLDDGTGEALLAIEGPDHALTSDVPQFRCVRNRP
jgi:hypothetical protein